MEKYVVEIYKPSYIDVSSHQSRYGILGPESFINSIQVKVVKTIFNNEIESEIIVEMNDTDVGQINSCKSQTLYIELKSSNSAYAKTSKNTVYKLVKALSKIEFDQKRNISFQRENSQQKIMFTVKSKTVSIPIRTLSSILFNDTIHEEKQITNEILELADSIARTTYGSTIKILQSDYSFDNSAPLYWTTVIVSPLCANYISDEIIYEVISALPLKK